MQRMIYSVGLQNYIFSLCKARSNVNLSCEKNVCNLVFLLHRFPGWYRWISESTWAMAEDNKSGWNQTKTSKIGKRFWGLGQASPRLEDNSHVTSFVCRKESRGGGSLASFGQIRTCKQWSIKPQKWYYSLTRLIPRPHPPCGHTWVSENETNANAEHMDDVIAHKIILPLSSWRITMAPIDMKLDVWTGFGES